MLSDEFSTVNVGQYDNREYEIVPWNFGTHKVHNVRLEGFRHALAIDAYIRTCCTEKAYQRETGAKRPVVHYNAGLADGLNQPTIKRMRCCKNLSSNPCSETGAGWNFQALSRCFKGELQITGSLPEFAPMQPVAWTEQYGVTL